MPPESPAERLAREHAARRKASGLPDPSHYKQMAAQKQKEIDAMKNEETATDRLKKYIRPVTKTTPKIEKTTEPAGRTTDHTEWKVTGPSGEIKRFKSKQEAHAHYDSFKEEVEELDEISAQLKTSYRQKAIADIRALRPHAEKGEYKDLAKNVEQADIVVAAIGKAHFLTADMIKPGSTVLDVGISRTEAGLLGDVHPDVFEVAANVAPMPGGVGPMTRAMLLTNVVEACE